jgi:hypothetical protein
MVGIDPERVDRGYVKGSSILTLSAVGPAEVASRVDQIDFDPEDGRPG